MLMTLRKIRKDNQITIYDMAEYLNITPSFYSQIESERRRLYYDTAVKIAFYFRVKPSDLFENNDKESLKHDIFCD